MNIKLTINTQDVTELCQGEVNIETTRKGSCGKLTFNLLNDEILDYHEGDEVNLFVNDINMLKAGQ